MGYYKGAYRQQGGGLGGIFSVLSRSVIPMVAKSAGRLFKSQAKKLAPKLLNAGVGLLTDLSHKKNFKEAVKSRGKRLISEAINQGPATKKRQSTPNRGRGKTRGTRGRQAGRGKKRDIFS